MPDRHGIVAHLMQGRGGDRRVTLRETYWGYVVQSARGAPRPAEVVLEQVRYYAVWVFAVAAGAVWLLPGAWLPAPVLAVKALVSVLLVAGALALVSLRRRVRGYELQVDLNRRELRGAVVDNTGRPRLRERVRFSEVGRPVIRRGKSEHYPRALCLELAGREELLPVAVGDPGMLMAVHDRLMGDLQPLEPIMPGLCPKGQAPVRAQARGFPRLGPDEVTI